MSDAGCLSEAFLQQSPACHWIVGADLRFCRVYGDSVPIFGKTAADLTGKSVAESLQGEAAAQWTTRLSRALKGESLALRERRGSSTWYIRVFPIVPEGASTFAGGFAGEITSMTKAEQELRNTVLGALKAQEFERNMTSKFLHDVVGQNMTALGLQLDLARMDMEPISPDTCARLGEIQKVLEDMMTQVRDYSYELNPSAVERAGLRSALDRLTTRIRERFPGSVRVNVDPSLKIDPKIASALYQITQEAVENSVQHSSCSAIEIAVKSTRTGPLLEVRDNGKGFDPADIQDGYRGLGLLSMEHYAAQAGLDLAISSNRGSGTTVRVSTPEAV